MLGGYTAALDSLNAINAAQLTSSPSAAAVVLGQTLRDMHPTKLEVTAGNVQRYSGGTATFDLTTHWNFGPDRDWEYTTHGTATDLSIGWRIQWDPSVLAPGINATTTLRQIRTDAPAPRVLAKDGPDLMFAGTVHKLSIDPSKTKDLNASFAEVAKIVAPVAPLITVASLTAEAKANPNGPVPVVDLRDDDYAVLSDDLSDVPGLTQVPAPDLLISDRQLFSPLFDGIKGAWQAERDATQGWAVQLVPASGPPTRVVGYQGPPGPDLRTSMDTKVQLQAENAVVQLGQPAAMVVVSISSGAVLAAAQNNQASTVSSSWALTGLSTTGPVLEPLFSVINKAAGTDAGKQKNLLDPLGIGTDFPMTGVQTVTASLPGRAGAASAQLSADTVKMSPFGAALMMAALAKGQMTAPYVVQGQAAKPSAPLGVVNADVRKAATDAMTATMAPSGDGSDLAGTKVRGLVGTNGPDGPGWFIGFRGDQAFAIMVTGPTSGAGSLQVASAYLG
ncbi:NTF2-like N-terminal transpeptidase domain-containing protein [Tsukamurella soli]